MNNESTDVLIIGAGYAGLSAALELVKAGKSVSIIESDSDIGGLAGTFEISPGHRIEKFYHHWFSNDLHVIGLIEELGLSGSLQYNTTNTGLYYANSIFRLASPLDLLKFPAIPFIDRIRTGLMALYARKINDWLPLENETASEWVIRIGGKKAYDVMWKPLLAGKFGAEAPNVSAVWFWNKLKLRGSSRSNKGAEQLVYFKGGFGALTSAIRKALEARGVKFELSCRATKIISEGGVVKGVETSSGFKAAKRVLATLPLPTFLDMTAGLPESYIAPARQIRFLGNVCLVFRLKRSLSGTYWLNVADPTFPFVGVIEHTNMDDKSNYGGEHIAYLSKYLPTSDKMFAMSDEELIDYCIPYIQKIFPEFNREWMIGCKVWRAEHSQPVITKHYSTFIPATKTPIKDLWLCTMAQVYPEDRGTNYAVRHGRAMGKEILSNWS